MHQRVGLVLGAVLAVVGCILAVRAMQNSRPNTPHFPRIEASAAVRATLNPRLLDIVPKPETIDDIQRDVRSRVIEEIRAVPTLAALPMSRQDDLAQAFIERWRALVDPDFERDFRTMVARGDPTPRADAEAFFESKSVRKGMTTFPVNVDTVFVRDHADASSPPSGGGFDGFVGFERLVSGRTEHQMPVPARPTDAGWRSVQIVMPFRKDPVFGEGLGVALVGFQFVWSERRSQWIPAAVVAYTAPGEAHSAIPLR